jgi:hypothetical protein
MDRKKSELPESRLIPVMREGICVVQMVLFKKLRLLLKAKYPEQDALTVAMLTGAITNELFGSVNEEEKFQDFRRQMRGIIEQELLGLAQELPDLRKPLTDALRMQTLCDQMEGKEDSRILTQADEIGILIQEAELPLPSTFMAMARDLGDTNHLISRSK